MSKTYGSQAKYYIGFMAYEGDDYDQASAYFDQVENTKFKNKSSRYWSWQYWFGNRHQPY